MKPELDLAEFVSGFAATDAPPEVAQTVRRVLLATAGAGIAGAGEDGIAALLRLLEARGGAGEARAFVFGKRLPAHAAAQFNGTLCRALDYCDALAPGAHIGSAAVPVALAAAELVGGCSGTELLSALVVGCEVGARLNLTESMYDGFDPTGVAVVFAATAVAARILQLTPAQTLNALGLAFNRCGGSFQSNIDGTLAIRVIQGWVAQTGIECAQLAQAGITGPGRFLSGTYGYARLFGRSSLDSRLITACLGSSWLMTSIVFKKYPSCGATQGLTELLLGIVAERELTAEHVSRVAVRLNPYCHRLVGNAFRLGDNPRVSAQFSAQYCAANAIVRRSSTLADFRPESVASADIQAMMRRVTCTGDPALDSRGHSAVDVALTTRDGDIHSRQLDVPPGFPGNPLSDEAHLARFEDCLRYAPRPPPEHQVSALLRAVDALETLPDARKLVDYLSIPV